MGSLLHSCPVSTKRGDLDAGLTRYRHPLPLANVHQLLSNVDLIAGESPTISSMEAVLGTSAVYMDKQEDCCTLFANFYPRGFGCVHDRADPFTRLAETWGSAWPLRPRTGARSMKPSMHGLPTRLDRSIGSDVQGLNKPLCAHD